MRITIKKGEPVIRGSPAPMRSRLHVEALKVETDIAAAGTDIAGSADTAGDFTSSATHFFLLNAADRLTEHEDEGHGVE